jgi:hypothetical protein
VPFTTDAQPPAKNIREEPTTRAMSLIQVFILE